MNKGWVLLWRLMVATSGATGVWLASRAYPVWWTALSQLSSLAVAIVFAVIAFREPRSPWLRGALATDLAWYVGGNLAVYSALDDREPMAFLGRCVILLTVLLAAGLALYAVGRRRRPVVVFDA